MRKQPTSPPPAVTPQEPNSVITQVREYELITPLFGGGITTGEADPVLIIRATEIRGQLRFWWRACRGGKFDDNLAAMKQAENEIWGAAYKKGEKPPSHEETVQIDIEIINQGVPIHFSDRSIPPYAAFPLQSDPKPVRRDISFKMTVSYPAKHKEEVEAALWAWETFGGVGARTRRGFGALHLLTVNGKKSPDIDRTRVEADIQEKLTEFVAPGKHPEGSPHFSQNLVFKVLRYPQNTLPSAVWLNLIGRLKNFRQARSNGTAGRSLWPEPGAIRHLTGLRDKLPSIQKFPRAAFGLPIVFHFTGKNAPADTTLQGTEGEIERLASPLILRPMGCSNNQVVGLALILEGSRPVPGPLKLIEKETGVSQTVQETLTKQEAQQIPVLHGETDVLKAFMNSLGGNTR